ncbi:hypothetical protein Tco_1281987 [Tanacetum coccineum]
MTNTRSGMTPAAIEEMINQRVDAALEARRVNRDLKLRNENDIGGGDGNGNGTGNGNNGGDNGDGNENRNENGRGDRTGARECTYQDFMKCQPLGFKGTEGMVGLIRWSGKMETVFPTFLAPVLFCDSLSGDSSERPLHSSSHSAGPSRKRCRSPADSVPSSTPIMGSLAPTRADLLPPRKRFRDSYSSEASIEEDTEIDPIETEVDMELGISDGDDVRDHVEIDPKDVRDDTEEYEADTKPAGEDSSDLSATRDDIVRSFEDMPIDLDDAVRDFYHHMSEVRIDRIAGIETVQRWLEADQLIARGQRVSMIKRIESLRLENFKVRAMLDIERDRVNSLRLHMSLSQEEFRQVRRDRDDTRGRLRRLESYVERRLGFRP